MEIILGLGIWGVIIYVIVKGIKAIFSGPQKVSSANEMEKLGTLARVLEQKGVITKDDFVAVVGTSFQNSSAAVVAPVTTQEPQESSNPSITTSSLPAETTPATLPADSAEHDFTLSGKWLTLVGITAIILGVGFFIKYSFDNNLISEMGRVVLGAVFGVAFLVAGDFLYKKYASYAAFLTGGGLGILYLSFYGAYGVYHIISQAIGLFFLVIVTAVAVALSIRYDKVWVAGVSVLGGFLTPALLGIPDSSPFLLLNYVLVLDLGLIGLSYARRWTVILWSSFVGTFLYIQWWFSWIYDQSVLWSTETYLTLYWLLFVVAMFFFYYSSNRKDEVTGSESLLMIFNALGYLGASYVVLHPVYGHSVSYVPLILAVIYGVLAWFGAKTRPESQGLFIVPLGLSLLSLSLVFPIAFENNVWIVAAWFIEAAIIAWMGARLRSTIFYFIIPVLSWAAVNLFGLMSMLDRQSQFIFNERTLLYFTAAISFFVCAYSTRKYYQSMNLPATSWAPALAIIGGILLALWGPQEIDDLALRAVINSQTAGVLTTIYLAMYALVLLVGGIYARSSGLRIGSIVLFVLVIAKTFLIDMWSLGGLYRISAMIFLGVILLVVGYLHSRYASKIKEFLTAKESDMQIE